MYKESRKMFLRLVGIVIDRNDILGVFVLGWG